MDKSTLKVCEEAADYIENLEAALLHSWKEFGGTEEDFSIRYMMECAGVVEEAEN